MGTVAALRAAILQAFAEWEQWPGEYAKFRVIPVVDTANDHYALLTVGWQDGKRIHSVLVHVDIIEDRAGIQADSTERGFALDLVAHNIPKNQIVLGFKSPERRRATEYAVG